MEKRIEINGVWYVREDSIAGVTTPVKIDTTYYIGAVEETETACFEFSVLTNEENVMMNDTQSITYTDKRGDRMTREIELWDNSEWLRELATTGKTDEGELPLSESDKNVLVAFLRELMSKGLL